ncbi:NUDIX domain-containing protein [Carboxydothermus hydrogenoformans]|uniref:MutT/nudix family protein n=1 Tax=Carboxydothermus hydrogenoformans (strain ATCC BAA-161 / DSM 6008 / Z-2901) TaxID=246194 RepID=Q3AC96_CARHZ|nr:NUDIX hydrolase [Carboxydothermus hydrogenoformans]ABB16085.1 mutT/nudix family protein [Carboxydothermus hydrogenoformans Z-2901]
MEKTIKSNCLFKGNILTVVKDEVLLENGKISTREVVLHPGAVTIIPIFENKIVFVEQYRYPVKERLLELPAGKLNKNEAPEVTAYRELLEETGFIAKKLQHLTTFYTTPGFSNEVMYLYLAKELQKTDPRPDEDEIVKTVFIEIDKIKELLHSNKIKDAKTLIGLFWFLNFIAF